MAIRAKDRERAADIEAPDAGAAGAGAMEAGPPAAARHHVLVMPDGYCLPAVTWEPAGPARGTVIALHAFGDFRLAFAEIGPALAARGVRVHAFDQRGFGDTEGHGRWHGFRRLVRDLRQVIQELRPTDGSRLFLLGESMGGGVALVAAARFRPEGVHGLILVEPAVRRGVRWRLVWDITFGTLALLAPGYSRRLTRGDHPLLGPAARRRLGGDPRIVRFIRADAYKGLLSLADAASAGTRRLRLPTLLLYGRADAMIPRKLFEQAARDLSPLVTTIRYAEAPHLLLQSEGWEEVVQDIWAWLEAEALPGSRAGQLLHRGPRPAPAA